MLKTTRSNVRQVEMDDNLRIWRSFQVGSLFDLIMLDTRQYDRSITDLYWNTDYIHQISNDAGRTMMGSRQENWWVSLFIARDDRAADSIVGSTVNFPNPLTAALGGESLARRPYSPASTSLSPTATLILLITMRGMGTKPIATAPSAT